MTKAYPLLVAFALLLCSLAAPATAAPALPAADPTPTPAASAPATSARTYVVAIDPGHGGAEVGASHRGWEGGPPLREKDVNLDVALKLAALLQERGYTAVLTRDTDRSVNVDGQDLNGNGVVDVDDDLQARVDVANAAHADALVSIHHNGSANPLARGTSVWYCAAHPQGVNAKQLAQLLQAQLLAHWRALGYEPVDQGANDDPPLGKPYGHLFVVGVKTPRVARESQMPGVVGEALYVTNDVEAQMLWRDETRAAEAASYRDALVEFLEGSG